jgi:hypothetical protein
VLVAGGLADEAVFDFDTVFEVSVIDMDPMLSIPFVILIIETHPNELLSDEAGGHWTLPIPLNCTLFAHRGLIESLVATNLPLMASDVSWNQSLSMSTVGFCSAACIAEMSEDELLICE